MKKVLVIGAGIGGLTSALALKQLGFEVEVFERAAELKEVGAGIGLSASAMRVLKHLGVMEAVVQRGAVIKWAASYAANGKALGRMRMDGTDTPSVCLHRADLQEVLFRAAPAGKVHLGREFVRLEVKPDGVTACFADGSSASGDCLVGVDGLRSRVRAEMIGGAAPVYRGYQCWRGFISESALRDARCEVPKDILSETFGRGLRVGIVPLGRRGAAWWCTANEPETATDEPEGAKSKLLKYFSGWHAPVPQLFAATDPKTIIKTGIYDREPSRRWGDGPWTLLGDAAHPTTPNMGQGGCMAIEDAAVLARCLANDARADAALRSYERMRYARTARITRISRYYGVMAQWQNPMMAWLRNVLLRQASGSRAESGYAKFVSYDACQDS